MAAQNTQLVSGHVTTGTAIETVYTSPAAGEGTRITAFTATNKGTATGNYSVYVVDTAATATDVNLVLQQQSVAQNKSDVPPETVNHFIPAGGTLQVQTNVAGDIAFRVSGIEYT